jgi:hypothetical protein
MKSILRDDVLYGTPDGRVFCGALRCSGATAHFSGHGLHGEAISAVDVIEVRGWIDDVGHEPRCEGCGLEATVVLDASGRAVVKGGGR